MVVDFDGTLTLRDVGDEICDRFADPSWRDEERALARREVSMVAAQSRMWPLVRASPDALEAHVRAVGTLRSGAAELLDAGAAGEIDLVLASGGFDFYIEQLLAPWIERHAFRARYANRGRPEAGSVSVSFPHDDLRCAYCAVCKGRVVQRHREGRPVVFVGDGVTDLCGARVASEVFAIRGGALASLAREEGIETTVIDTLWPVLERLRAIGHAR